MSKSDALRLADALNDWSEGPDTSVVLDEAAAELRRLHELAMNQQGEIYTLGMARSMEKKTAKLMLNALEKQRDELLNALRNLLAEGEFNDYPNTTQWYAVQAARAAIVKAEGA